MRCGALPEPRAFVFRAQDRSYDSALLAHGPYRTLITFLDAAVAARKPDIQTDGTHLARH